MRHNTRPGASAFSAVLDCPFQLGSLRNGNGLPGTESVPVQLFNDCHWFSCPHRDMAKWAYCLHLRLRSQLVSVMAAWKVPTPTLGNLNVHSREVCCQGWHLTQAWLLVRTTKAPVAASGVKTGQSSNQLSQSGPKASGWTDLVSLDSDLRVWQLGAVGSHFYPQA
jgi:hypothetical protein